MYIPEIVKDGHKGFFFVEAISFNYPLPTYNSGIEQYININVFY